MALVIKFSVQKLRHYTLLSQTRVMDESNPMIYLLSHRLIEDRATKCTIILEDYDLEFVTPKSTKFLVLASLMAYFPSSSTSLPITINVLIELLFVISMKDPWYGAIVL